VIRILLLGLVLAGVWYLYRMVTQQNATAAPPVPPANDAAPAEAAAEAATEQPASEQAAALEQAAIAEAQEMIECPVCQAYVPETAHDGCGRPDCPVPALAADRARG
jgi:uncharacterized iron-regulated membrane protein